jgi:hypothetical protein
MYDLRLRKNLKSIIINRLKYAIALIDLKIAASDTGFALEDRG